MMISAQIYKVLYIDFEHLACSQGLYFNVLMHAFVVFHVYSTCEVYETRGMNLVQVRVKNEV